jgi:extracellular factor (EF) 3-hydroxypalmitic acid methyl ester biosynthesis protein
MFYPFAMSQTLNGNGNGVTTTVPAPLPQRPLTNKEAHVTFPSADGTTMRGSLVSMSRHSVAFEFYSPGVVLTNSEVLEKFSVNVQGESIYLGRAVICSLVDVGTKTLCEATLDETLWRKADSPSLSRRDGQIANEFKDFLKGWQKFYIVAPEFKVAVADLETFLRDLQLWLNQSELKIKLSPKLQTDRHELEIVAQLAEAAIPAIDMLFEKFESVANGISGQQRAAHASYMRQHLHPLVLCTPFANRTFEKPRGYAGDYEMVNMIIRNGFEGDSLFAKILHAWFVNQPPAKAHRNRIKYLAGNIARESFRATRASRAARIFNFACGPAAEIQEFIQTQPFPIHIDFTLADFEEQTLEFIQRSLRKHHGPAQSNLKLNYRKMSVLQLIKEHRRVNDSEAGQFDLVYCAGLFDYLPDNSCKQLMNIFYEMLAPGGLLIATNVEPSNPLRYGMEYLLDWHLIYRNDTQMRDIRPDAADKTDVCIRTDATGVNLFLEVRKPDHG